MVPEAGGETKGVEGGELLMGIGGEEGLQLGADLFLVHAGPVDDEWGMVVVVGEVTGGIAGELEDGGTAHAPMGDEQGPCGAELGAGDGGCGTLDNGAHEGAQRRVFDAEGEEGRHRGLYFVAEVGEPAEAGEGGLAAGGEGDERLTQVIVKVRGSVIVMVDRGDGCGGANLDAEAAGMVEEAVDDDLRVLGCREDAMVGLHGEGHAVALEPGVGIVLGEAF